jgi:hypothetical protein
MWRALLSQNAKPTHLCRTRSFLKSKMIITSSHEVELISKKVYHLTKCRDFLSPLPRAFLPLLPAPSLENMLNRTRKSV